jgi:hypothetical protein
MSSHNSFRFCLLILFAASPSFVFAQENTSVASCSEKVHSALKPLPQLVYDCPEGLNDSDDSILKLPARFDGLKSVAAELQSFTNPAWWEATVSDLNFCDLHGTPGNLSAEEKDRMRSGDYQSRLFGDNRFRLVLVFDPCYQVGYNGSNLFLIYRPQQKVFVSQLMNGFYTRVENSIDMGVGRHGGEPIIEVRTGNTMPPTLVNYYFTIDPKTNLAVPKKLFKEGSKLTNKVHSAMLLEDPAGSANVLRVIKARHLVKSFSAYEEDEHGKIGGPGQELRRVIYRWNGRFYTRSNR